MTQPAPLTGSAHSAQLRLGRPVAGLMVALAAGGLIGHWIDRPTKLAALVQTTETLTNDNHGYRNVKVEEAARTAGSPTGWQFLEERQDGGIVRVIPNGDVVPLECNPVLDPGQPLVNFVCPTSLDRINTWHFNVANVAAGDKIVARPAGAPTTQFYQLNP